jgi:hypothetical protein
MQMKKRYFLILSLMMLSLLAANCQDPNDAYIQGAWEFNSDHLAEIVSEEHLTVIWFFSGGSFTYQSCCFNMDIDVGGRYRILDSSEDRITIELYNTYGSGSRFGGEILIVIDRENDEINIQGTGPFHRLGPA